MAHRNRGRSHLLILAFGVAACSGADQNAELGEWSGTRELVNGVEVVRNPSAPLFGERTAAVDSLWAAPSSRDEARSGLWEEPVAVRVAGGYAFVLDRMAHRVHAIGTGHGQWERSIGQGGGGPGEFQDPFGIAVEEEEVAVGNGGSASIERFDMDGQYTGTVRFNELAFSLHALEPHGYLILSVLGAEGGWNRVSRNGEVTPFPWPQEGALGPAELSEDCVRISTGGSQVFRLSCRHLAFQVISSEGILQRWVIVDRPPDSVPVDEVEAHLQEVRKIMQGSGLPQQTIESQVDNQRQRMERNPRMRAVRVDRKTGCAAVWEQKPEDLGSGPANLHVFSPEGVYLVQIAFEHEWVDFDLYAGAVHALVRDPQTDLVKLITYKLDLPELRAGLVAAAGAPRVQLAPGSEGRNCA